MNDLMLDDGYREFFALDKIEALSFFISYPNNKLTNGLGLWFNIFDYMRCRSFDTVGQNNDISWKLIVKTSTFSHKFSRELHINIGNDIIKIALEPHYYFDKSVYNDLRFSVSAKRKEAVALLYLYAENFNK